MSGSYEESIKTRIETQLYKKEVVTHTDVVMKSPLKQGLKQRYLRLMLIPSIR